MVSILFEPNPSIILSALLYVVKIINGLFSFLTLRINPLISVDEVVEELSEYWILFCNL